MPLDSWTADMGGRGVTILAAFQSRAQLIARWGTTGAAIILNNTAAVMVFGGTKDRDDLDYWSTLAGDRDEPVSSFDDHGRRISRTVRKVPVLAAAQLANLPAGRVVVFRRGMAPVIGRVRPAWRRRDVRAHLRSDRRQTRVLLAGAEAATRSTHPGAGEPPVAHPATADPGAVSPASPGRPPLRVIPTRADRS